MTVHLDISQLLADPRRSGIQRAERELIRHWPGPEPLVPCRFDAATDGMLELPGSVLEVLCKDAEPGGVAAEIARLEPHLVRTKPVVPERLLNAELFLDPARAAYYYGAPPGCRAYWLIYDFLPWLHPEWFSVGSPARLMPYLRAMRAVPELAFISHRTRADCADRILRRPQTGPVIPMGGDGLGLERQTFDTSRRSIVMLGTIEPRKNAACAMQACQTLWSEGIDVQLVMIGTVSPDATVERGLLAALSGDRRLVVTETLPDAGIRDALRRARAMLFPSEGEGFGIPPMEALHAGIPVIVASSLPALDGQASFGQIRLDDITPETVAAAIRTVLDDEPARRLWGDAAIMPVPGWADFACRVAGWVGA